MPPDEPNAEERLEELSEDNGTPFQPADPQLNDAARTEDNGAVRQRLDDTHPVTDTDFDQGDAYENGEPGAAGSTEPNAGSAVTGYNGVPNPMVDDDADIDAPSETLTSQDEEDNTTMEEV